MNLQTIQASHTISTCLFAYYMGADALIVSVKAGLYPDTTFTDFTFGLAIAAFLLTLLNGIVITDVEDIEGFFGKAIALSKGIVYKKINFGHLAILCTYTIILNVSYFAGGLNDKKSAMVLLGLVVANLLVPIALIFLSNPETIKRVVGEPSEIEKKLANKGVDKDFSQAAIRIDFWYMSICAMNIIGISRVFDENAFDLGLHNEEQGELIEQTYGVFEVIGATVVGTILTLFRAKVRPSLCVIFVLLIGGLGQVAMVYPNSSPVDPMILAVASAAFAEGGILVSLASFCHEEYGTENFGILFGTMLTFGAAGLYAYDAIFFPNIFEWFAEENGVGVKHFKSYGKWNEMMFSWFVGGYVICFFLAVISHISVKRRDRRDSMKLAMSKF